MVEKVYKIKDVFNLFAGGDVNHSHFSEYKTSAYFFCVYSNSLADHGLYGYTDVPKYSGDSITITGRGSIGHAEYRPFDFDAIIRLLVLIPKYKDIIDSRYVTELINSYVKFPLESTGVPQLTVPQIENIEISLPTIEVQRKIANALSDMDSMISLLEKLIAKYKSIKAACLQQMFPQNGETVPRMRLPGFTDDWEQRKLKSITSVITKGTTPLDKSNSGTVNFIKVENIDNSSGEISISQKISMEEHEGYLKRSQLQENDILFSIAGTLGRVTSVNSNILPTNTNQALAIIRLKECNLDYIKTFLKSKAVENYIRHNPTIGAQPNLSLEQVGNLKIQVPSVNEQQKIGTYFRNLDSVITLYQRKLKKVQKIKQGMMQQLLTGKIRLV